MRITKENLDSALAMLSPTRQEPLKKAVERNEEVWVFASGEAIAASTDLSENERAAAMRLRGRSFSAPMLWTRLPECMLVMLKEMPNPASFENYMSRH